MSQSLAQQLKIEIQGLLNAKGVLTPAKKKQLSDNLGITTTYLNQLLSDKNEKIPSLEILEKLSQVLSLRNEEVDLLKTLREKAKSEKKKEKLKKETKITQRTESLEEAALQRKINREDAIAAIYQKLSENPEDLKKFLSGNFPGFDNLEDASVQKFYNRYYLSLDSDDSVVVFSRKPLQKSIVIQLLLQRLYDKLDVSSIEEVQMFADQTLDSFVRVLPDNNPIIDQEQDEAPVQDTEGEGEFDTEATVGDPDIEENADDYDMDDITWVSPNSGTSTELLDVADSAVSGAELKSREYLGGFTPIALGASRNPIESYRKLLSEI